MAVESILSRELLKHNVDCRRLQWLEERSELLAGRRLSQLFLRRDLEGPELLEEAAIQLARLELGHTILRPVGSDARRDRRELRAAKLWAARKLMPAEVMCMAFLEEWEVWQLAEYAQVSLELAEIRMRDWLGFAPFFK